jgi:hypothetical protein
MSYRVDSRVDAATSSGILVVDINECRSEDNRVFLKRSNMSFSTSVVAGLLINISASDENIGDNDAVPIKAKRLRGKICDIGCVSTEEFIASHTLPTATSAVVNIAHPMAVDCSLYNFPSLFRGFAREEST